MRLPFRNKNVNFCKSERRELATIYSKKYSTSMGILESGFEKGGRKIRGKFVEIGKRGGRCEVGQVGKIFVFNFKGGRLNGDQSRSHKGYREFTRS